MGHPLRATPEQNLMTLGNQSCSQLHTGHTVKGAPPTVGGFEEPVWPWQPVWLAQMAVSTPLAMGGAIIREVSLTKRTISHPLGSNQDVASEKEIKIETKFPACNSIYSSTFEGVFNHRHITELVFLLEIHLMILQLREAQNVSTMFSKKCQLSTVLVY